MSTRADFPSLDQYIEHRVQCRRYQRSWQDRNPDKVRVYRARDAVRHLAQSIESQRAKQAELIALLELDEGTLVFVHETCRANVLAELQKLEGRLQVSIECHSKAVANLENIT